MLHVWRDILLNIFQLVASSKSEFVLIFPANVVRKSFLGIFSLNYYIYKKVVVFVVSVCNCIFVLIQKLSSNFIHKMVAIFFSFLNFIKLYI